MSITPDKFGHPVAIDKTRRLIFVVAAIVAVLAISGLVIYLKTRPAPQTAVVLDRKLDGGIRSGAEFEKYRDLIKLDEPEGEYANSVAGGIEMRMATTVRNFTGRTITGLEIKGSVIGLEDKSIKDRTVIAIPSNVIDELENNQTARVPVSIPGFKGEDAEKIETGQARLRMEVTAIKLK